MQIMGLVSPLKDYRLAHFLGGALRIDFEKQEDLESAAIQPGQEGLFSNFSQFNPLADQFIHLIFNRSSGVYFLPSIKEFDYLLVFCPVLESNDLKETIQAIKGILDIVECIPIPLSVVKEKERLICFIP